MCKVHIDGSDWPSTEHYFQAQKFVGTPCLEKIRKLRTPREAFQISRQPDVSIWRRRDWEDVKNYVMYKALLIKFTQHEDLRKKLIGTDNRELIENSRHDSYWGIGKDGSGHNLLGQLLMQVRNCCKVRSIAITSVPGGNFNHKKTCQSPQIVIPKLSTQTMAIATPEHTEITETTYSDSGVTESTNVLVDPVKTAANNDDTNSLCCCRFFRRRNSRNNHQTERTIQDVGTIASSNHQLKRSRKIAWGED